MANNTLLASDNFASGSLASGWSAISGLSACQVTGSPKVTEPNSTGTLAGQIWTGLAWPNDQICEVTINNLTTADAQGVTQVNLWVRKNFATNAGYFATLQSNGTTSGRVLVEKNDGSGSTQLGSTVTTLGIPAGSIFAFAAIGSSLSVYLNGIRVFYIGDATYTAGAPAFSQLAATNVNHSQVSSWRGYSAVQQDGIWTKQGVIIAPTAAELANSALGTGITGLEGVRREGNAQILSGLVYKGYFDNLNGVNYAESSDGINWTRYGSNPVISGYGAIDVFKYQGTYYLWSSTIANVSAGPALLWTSVDGVTWTGPTSTTGLTAGAGGAWDNPTVYFGLHIADVIGGVFYGLYSATNLAGTGAQTGLVTSPDGLAWTKYGSNPVLNAFCGTQILKVGSTYYAWFNQNQTGQGQAVAPNYDPFSSVRYQSTDLINWTNPTHSIQPTGMAESLNSKQAGVFTTAVVQVGNRVAMYYEGSPGDSTGPQVYQCCLALAPVNSTLKQIVAGTEDGVSQVASDAFSGGAGGLGANWTTLTGRVAPQVVSGPLVEPNSQASGSGAMFTGASFTDSQYSEVTIHAAAASSVIALVVRAQAGATTWYQGAIVNGVLGTIAQVTINRVVAGTSTSLFNSTAPPATPQSTPHLNDVFRLTVVNGSDGFPLLSIYQNGFLICQMQDYNNSIPSGGNPGFIVFDSAANVNASIARWAGGNANVIPTYHAGGMVSGGGVCLDDEEDDF